jgi:hypothetical protein
MLIRSTRQRAIPVLRGKPPRISCAASHQAQALVPLHSFIVRERSQACRANFTQTRLFSHTPATMAAQKLDGTAIAKGIREKLNAEILEKQKSNPRYKPSLVIIQGMFGCRIFIHAYANSTTVGDRPDSSKLLSEAMQMFC